MNTSQKLLFIVLLYTFTLESKDTTNSQSIVLCFNQYPQLKDAEQLAKQRQTIDVIQGIRGTLLKKEFGTNNRTLPEETYFRINLAGIPILYYGFITFSKDGGIVLLPYMHEENSFTVFVTSNIQPIFMLRNTIHHFELLKENNSQCFLIEKKYDESTKTHFWSVTKQNLPENGFIPLESIIILVNPEELYIPEGITLTNDNPQAILPSIYVKHDTQRASDGLAALNINFLFRSIDAIKQL